MKQYELINPSDKIYLQAPDERFAIAAAISTGGGKYGLVDMAGNKVCPIMIFGVDEEFFKEKFGGMEEYKSFLAFHMNEVADCFDTFHLANGGERTSLNDICGYAKTLAIGFRKAKQRSEEKMAKTYWNGEPANVRHVKVKVGKAAKETYWYAKLEGTIRKAVEVEQGGERFLIDNEDGGGWLKVTKGMGSPTYAHSSLSGEIVD